MDFEDYKAAWQQAQQEEYLKHPITSEIIAEIAAEARRLERYQFWRDSMSVGLFLGTTLAFISLIVVESSTIARLATAVMMGGVVAEFLFTARETWLERHSPPDLPLKPALIEERKQILAQLRRFKVRLAIYAAPIIGGFLLLQFTKRNIEDLLLGAIMAVCCSVFGGAAKSVLKDRERLGRALQGIDKDLAVIAEIEAEGE